VCDIEKQNETERLPAGADCINDSENSYSTSHDSNYMVTTLQTLRNSLTMHGTHAMFSVTHITFILLVLISNYLVHDDFVMIKAKTPVPYATALQ